MSDNNLRLAMLAWAKSHERGVAHQDAVRMLRQIVALAERYDEQDANEAEAIDVDAARDAAWGDSR